MEQQRQREQQQQVSKVQTQQAVQQKAEVYCPKCGTACSCSDNFCEECGESLKGGVCPSCGCKTSSISDVCGKCGTFLSKTKCSYCGVDMGESDMFCGECGNPRGGVTCGNCGTVTAFNFCLVCYTPLTEMGKAELKRAQKEPKFQEMQTLSVELKEICKKIEQAENIDNREKEELLRTIKERVAQYESMLQEESAKPTNTPKPKKVEKQEVQKQEEHKPVIEDEELKKLKQAAQQKLQQLSDMCNEMANQTFPNPQIARTYYAARIPKQVEVVWECNFMHYIHPNPHHCANPARGGKWVPYYEKIEWQYGIE